ncbi:hypothetical protein LIER_27223 [Lithospermum erythrorhizon]|uniref:F-box domain-containing protein n=1 Tax=Lithospermum erythrorhizon TaxID=34254 RepID=A0AAV3RBI7_LITER
MKTRSGFETNVKKPELKTIWLHPKGRRPRRNRTTLLRSSSNKFGKTLPNIPFDIQLNIISRLPAKLIFGCKSLSKAFNASISEPSFTRIYHNNYYSAYSSSSLNPIFINPSSIRYGRGSNHIELELVEFQTDVYTNDNPIISKGTCFSSSTLPGRGDPDYGSSIWGQCNGLCCFLKLDSDILNLFLTNPLSGEFIKLPDPVKCDEHFWWRSMMAYGLGYCQTTERYKVLRIVTNYLGGGVTNYDTKTQIFTIGVDKKWRDVLDVNVPFNIRPTDSGPNPQSYMVAFRSALHWKVKPIRMYDGFEIEPKRGSRTHSCIRYDRRESLCASIPSSRWLPILVWYGSIDGQALFVGFDDTNG